MQPSTWFRVSSASSWELSPGASKNLVQSSSNQVFLSLES